MIERIWIIGAGLLALTAAVFLWRNNLSAAFVTGTLGAVAWFLSYRAELRSRMVASEQDPGENDNHEEFHQE